MKKVKLDLKEKDWIVHASHGVGVIKGVDTKKIRGDKQLFYIVKTDKLTYWLPVVNSHSDRIRSVCAPSTFSKALSTVRKKPKILSNNYRARVKHIKDEMSKCSLSANARLLRDLHARNTVKGLHVNEHRILEKLKTQFINEWSVASGIEKEPASDKLKDALLQSMKEFEKKK